MDSSGGAVDKTGRTKETRPGTEVPERAVTKRFQTGPAATDIPLAGDAGRLWTTDDAASVLPGFDLAHNCSAGEESGDALLHGNSYV